MAIVERARSCADRFHFNYLGKKRGTRWENHVQKHLSELMKDLQHKFLTQLTWKELLTLSAAQLSK